MKLSTLTFFISLIISAFAWGQDYSRFDRDLSLILEGVHTHYGVDSISIGGGTARSVIQTALQGRPFVFRDFDIVLSVNQPVTNASAYSLGQTLEDSKLGIFSRANLRPRPRYNPKLVHEAQARQYNAGYGFFVDAEGAVEYDISLYHSPEDLRLNGIMDVDQFQIVLKRGEKFSDLLHHPDKLRAALIDPQNALDKLLQNKVPAISNWGEVKKDPYMVSIRIVRTLGKFNALPLDEVSAARIKKYMASYQATSTLQIARNLLKLFEDSAWNLELKSLSDLGLFKNHFTSFEKLASAKAGNIHSKEAITRLLFRLADKKDSLQFLKLLSDVEPEFIQKMLPELISIKKLKVGYFTGEFAPFHKGHEGVAQTALDKGGLDLVFVIATPHASNNPKTAEFDKTEWNERIQFVKKGLGTNPGAWAWPLTVRSEDGPVKLADVIQDVTTFTGSKRPLTHVFGMDSFYRVLAHDLIDKDPRPRIAVTRPGVKIPGPVEKNVQILENVVQDPISATQLLQEIAVTGTTKDLQSDTLKQLAITPRYQQILAGYRDASQSMDRIIPGYDNYTEVSIIVDIRENRAGLYDPYFPVFSKQHEELIKKLLEKNPKEILIPLPKTDYVTNHARRSWMKALTGLGLPNVRVWTEADGFIANEKIAAAVHSGVINNHLKKSTFEHNYKRRGLIVFETADQPLSPLFKNQKNVLQIKLGEDKFKLCRLLFAN